MRTSVFRWVIALAAVTTALGASARPSPAAEETPPVKKHAARAAHTAAPAADTESQKVDEQQQRLLEDNQRRIKELETTVDHLKKDQRQTEVTLENQKPLASWSDGFWIKSADDRFKLKIGAYTQFDSRFFIDDSQNRNPSQFTFRRARIDLQGTVFKYFDFRILPDFAGSKAVLFDAYVDANFIPEAKFRFGKFKPPVGLERLQPATSLMFIERGLPTDLVPNRDNGVQIFGDLWNGAFSYQLGIFNGVPDAGNGDTEATNTSDDKEFAGRVFGQPLKNTSIDALTGLGLGIAGSYGRESGSLTSTELPTYKTFGQATFFQYASDGTAPNTAVAIGPHSRISPQTYYYYGPFGFLAEYVRSAQEVHLGAKAQTIDNNAWQFAGSYVITGELGSYRGVAPAQPFDPFEGKWGAVEATARYGQLEIDPDAFKDKFASSTSSARRAKEWVIGANWYLNKNIKFVLDYANTAFRGGAKVGDRRAESGVFTRVQLAF